MWYVLSYTWALPIQLIINKLQYIDQERLGKEGGTRGDTWRHMQGETKLVSMGRQGAGGNGNGGTSRKGRGDMELREGRQTKTAGIERHVSGSMETWCITNSLKYLKVILMKFPNDEEVRIPNSHLLSQVFSTRTEVRIFELLAHRSPMAIHEEPRLLPRQ